MSLLVMGTVALDNLRTPQGERNNLLGGSAAHFCMSAGLFTQVHLAGVVGTDFPKKHLQFLRSKQIDLTALIHSEGKSFRWVGEYKKGNLNNAITHETEIGVLGSYRPVVADHQRKLPMVFLANSDPDVQAALLKEMEGPKLIGLDSMNLWIDIKQKSLRSLIRKVHLFVLNDGEARELTQEHNIIRAARTLAKMGPRWIVIKKGEHGVLFYSSEFKFAFPAFPVEKVVDPTGAGDTFAGGLMGYLSRSNKIDERTFRRALLYATVLASYNVEGFGMNRTARLTMGDVELRMKEYLRFLAAPDVSDKGLSLGKKSSSVQRKIRKTAGLLRSKNVS